MELGLSGRVALVTGASSGLGLAVASRLAAEGAHVALAARDPERLAEARERVAASGPGQVTAQALDVRDERAVASWVDGVAAELGAVHVVVANAGGPPAGRATAFGRDAYREAFELSALALIGVVQAALPHVRAAGWGRILLVASEAIVDPLPEYALSTAIRPALAGYATALVSDLGPGDVTVNVLAPGYHLTPLVEGFTDEARRSEIARGIPLGRLGRPDDFGAVAAFLASEPANFITGAVVPVHGGGTHAA
ncbi:MAG TPA: SDR family oxidoreductase [Solirubrobacteraceae bacterium]|nr:SDR family oxidoreductase [Solirubrobacteraceae bacterium]